MKLPMASRSRRTGATFTPAETAGELVEPNSAAALRERFYVVPGVGTTRIAVDSIRFDGAEFVRDRQLYAMEQVDSEKDILGIWAIRPEGEPLFTIVVENQNEEAVYPISYDGKDGNQPIEYIGGSPR